MTDRPARVASAWRFSYKFARPWLPTRSAPIASLPGALARADLVVSSGGGFLNDTFAVHAMGVLSLLAAAQRRGVPTAMFGQGLGPLTRPWLTALARRVLPRLRLLSLREEEAGIAILLNLNVEPDRVCMTGDDALRLAGAGQPAAYGDALGVNVRMSTYARVDQDDAERLRRALGTFLNRGEAATIVSVPVSGYARDLDQASIRAILPAGIQVAHDEAASTPAALAAATSRCRALMTGSYHAGVFALARGIPVVGLSRSRYYDLKFAGLRGLFPAGAVRVVSLDDPDAEAKITEALEAAWHTDRSTRDATAARAAEHAAAREACLGGFLRSLPSGVRA